MMSHARIRYAVRAAGTLLIALILICGLVAEPVPQQAAQESIAGDRAVIEKVVIEKTDPATGARWALVRDAANPGGPGRWLLADSVVKNDAFSAKKLVIRTGDRIVVEEQTAVSEAWLEATALTGAADGGVLRARIAIGGQVVTARAIAVGRAELKETGR
jgi:hypothetical protein